MNTAPPPAPATGPAADAGLNPAALRLPTSPYPGLRPFLDHEDMLMHGRQTQVSDVVKRLGRQQRPAGDAPATLARFVAVVGGSGSGKSSLMRAGVVPYLRQFGIPEAGDLWESVVATPGTNFQPDADGVVSETPITRLAAKFERVLRGEHSPRRCEALAQMLRRDGGLGRMVDEFAPQLALPPGVRPEDACVLIVIDQFEELFHKTNSDRADARAMVERVIDHFHAARQGQGSAKCFLAITMRSEHLDDCAGFLGLPEAINSGGYLVSRLGEAQLREVIERPAQRYLRLRQRERQARARQLSPEQAAALPELPRSVVFEDGVVDALVAATAQIHHDPDHLPLLQHALARTWSAACRREGLRVSDVPQQILLVDLWRAGQAEVDPPAPPDKADNLLRLSLDSWAEHALRSHATAKDRDAVLAVMRRLAYKDPRTGNYNQQRLYVSRQPLGEAALKALLQDRWIDDVDYLHWDDEDPQRVTLKVSHESFIRGWQRLRKLADDEATRLDRYMQLLEATQIWLQHGKPDAELLDQRMLDRMAEAEVEAALGPPGAEHDGDPETATGQDWRRWLVQLPRGEALKAVARLEVREYLRRSVMRQEQRVRDDREKAESEVRLREENAKAQAEAAAAQAQAARAQAEAASARAAADRAVAQKDAEDARKGRLVAWSTGLFVVCIVGAFALVVMVPLTVRSQHHFEAAGLANQVSPTIGQSHIGFYQDGLGKLIKSAGEFEVAVRPTPKASGWLIASLAPAADAVLAWPVMNRLNLAALLPDAAATVESIVNRQLWEVLTHSLWLAGRPEPPDDPGIAPGIMRQMYCVDDQGGLFGMVATEGGAQATATERRGILISDDLPAPPAAGKSAVAAGGKPQANRQVLNRRIFSVQVRSGPATPDRLDACALGSALRVMPIDPGQPASKPAVMVDATLGHLFVSTPSDGAGGRGSNEILEVMPLVWPERGRPGTAELGPPIAVITNDSQAVQDLRDQVTSADGLPRPGQAVWPTEGGRAIQVGDRRWQLVLKTAHAVAPLDKDLRTLDPSQQPGCLAIGRQIQTDYAAQVASTDGGGTAPVPPLNLSTFDVDDYCLVLETSQLPGPSRPAWEQVNLQVFRQPAPGDFGRDNRLLRVNLVNDFDFGRVRQAQKVWKTGAAGTPWEGWLLLDRPAEGDAAAGRVGLSWSTAALRRLADKLLRSHCAALGAAPAAGRVPCPPLGAPPPALSNPGA